MSSTGKEKNVLFKRDVTVKNIEPFLFNYSKLLQIVNKIPASFLNTNTAHTFSMIGLRYVSVLHFITSVLLCNVTLLSFIMITFTF